MNREHELSHRQEREQKKEEHTPPTRGRYLSSKHLTWAVVVGVIITGAAAIIWTFLLPVFNGLAGYCNLHEDTLRWKEVDVNDAKRSDGKSIWPDYLGGGIGNGDG